MAVNQFTPGEVLDAARLNEIVDLANQNEIDNASNAVNISSTTGLVNQVRSNLDNQYVDEVVDLWSGDLYLDGSSNYTLWSSSLHRNWDFVRVYVAYDTRSRNGSGGHCFEILCGSNYAYNQDSNGHSTLCTTYDSTYRRLCVRTDGLNVVAGNGGGWYLTKVQGVVRKKLTY